MSTPIPNSGLAKYLIKNGLIDANTSALAQQEAIKENLHFVTYLVSNGIVNSSVLAQAVAEEFGYPYFNLDVFDFDLLPKNLVSEKLIHQHRALPLYKRGRVLSLAVSDPTNLSGFEEIKFNTSFMIDIVVVEEEKLAKQLARFLDNAERGIEIDNAQFSEMEEEGGEADTRQTATITVDPDNDKPIVRFVNKVLLDAIKSGASDIHFEPYEKAFRIRFRSDGILTEITRPPLNLVNRVSARLKVMAQLDISERRLPQDGRIKLQISRTRAIDFRVNCLPTMWGEKIVLRILDADSAKLGIDALGYEPEQKRLFMEALEKPQGMVLITGPTGSGKTVSLYTGLNILNTTERNISTAEDPVEINLEGINQVNVLPKIGLDFTAALKAFLRQDPDIIMVGEIRDLDTAQIAIKAAQTGHMVLSTLHTNSAPETLTRLRNMGVPSFNIATSVTLIIAQRLARRLCTYCKEQAHIPEKLLIEAGFPEEEVKDIVLFKPVGCERCKNGYKGRTGIYEVVKVTDSISRIVMNEGNSIEIADMCRKEGFNDLRASALKKARNGLIGLEEVYRVTTGH